MHGTIYTIPILRAMDAIGDFPMGLAFSNSYAGRRSEVVPQVGHALKTLVAFEPIGTDRRLGDLLDLSSTPFAATIGCQYAKAIDPRPYPRGVQSDLQRVPYRTLSRWTLGAPAPVEDGVDVPDAVYAAAASVLCYLEPMDDMGLMTPFGTLDRRQVFAYTEVALGRLDNIRDDAGDWWEAEAGSELYPVLASYRTQMRHKDVAPQGV